MSLLTLSPSDRNRKTIKTHNNIRKRIFRPNDDSNSSGGQFLLDTLWRETQQLMERSEQLVLLITHVCTQNLSGAVEPSNSCCPRLLSECSPPHMCDDGSGRPDEKAPTSEDTLEDGASSPPGIRDFYSDQSTTCREGKFYSNSHHSSQTRIIPSSGLKGSGAGPPIKETSKRKQTKSSSWTSPSIRPSFKSSISAFLILVSFIAGVTESCSSRSTPKPRPPSATLRPNVTFPTYACPPAYAAWFCLNGATCFTVKIQDAILYNCECAEGYMGPRCEFKDLDGSYLPARERVLLETASIAGGACIAIIFVVSILFALYVFLHKDREKRRNLDNPYHDKKPLKCSDGTDFICTITPVHLPHARATNKPSIEIICPDKNEKPPPPRDLYLVEEVDRVSLCTCKPPWDDMAPGHLLCENHFPKILVPSNVPKYM